jgi:hypothetical protein
MKRRYCGPCDDTTNGNPCPQCGADTEPWPCDGSDADRFYQRHRDDDDGLTYSDPRDARDERRGL